MSEILSIIKSDYLVLRKAGAKAKVSFLSSLIGEIESKATMVDGKKVVSEADAIAVLKSYEKKNSEFRAINDLPVAVIENLDFELELIRNYLPKQLTNDEIRNILIKLETTNLGEMMKHLKENYSGLYDGKLASSIAKELA